jgi:hypothetical protein
MQKIFRLSFSFLLITVSMKLGPAVYAQELLENQGFESGSLSSWTTDWSPITAGALPTMTAAHSGTFGLWEYTDLSAGNSFSGTYQQVSAQPSQSYFGSAWVRTTSTWVSGGEAFVRVQFMNSSSGALAYYDSSHLTEGSIGWLYLSVQTPPAPSGTAYVRLILRVQKAAGPNGQAVANFDDGSLTLAPSPPVLSLSRGAVSLGEDSTQVSVDIANTGEGTLHWQANTTAPWLTLSAYSGDTVSGPDPISLNADRTGLTLESYHAVVSFTSDGGDVDLDVYLDTPRPYTVPELPSIVTTNGYQLMVQRRLPGGSLHVSQPYTILGVGWAPASVGTQSDPSLRQLEFSKWSDVDIAMLREMRANTVYVFLDFGTGSAGIQLLDQLYKNHIMAIVTVDWDGTNETAYIAEVVSAYKNHPAVLMWAIGNEWNINLYHDKYDTLLAAANATQAAAQQIKALDSNHPVASIFGDISIEGADPSTNTIVNSICTAVDAWGVNIYRGPTFGTLFSEWKAISAKPIFISEFGTDSYHTTTTSHPIEGYVDESMQDSFVKSLLDELAGQLSSRDSNNVCIGGTIFEWVDEWWKVKVGDGGSIDRQDNGGFFTTWNSGAHPDGCANEEYFGVVRIDRSKKQLFGTAKNSFAALYGKTLLSDFDSDGRSDVAVRRPDSGTWYALLSGSSGNYSAIPWGFDSDLPVAGDYDGDGISDIAVWRPGDGAWYVLPSNSPHAYTATPWGVVSDIPVPGDYNGDGLDEIAVWRPDSGTWFILMSGAPGGYTVTQWGMDADIPVPGDYDGDGKTDIAVWRPDSGAWFVLQSGNPGSYTSMQWGIDTDIPTPGDYNGDGKTDIAVWRPSEGNWYVLPSGTSASYTVTAWGMDGDTPVSGDYDGDGKTDISVWRPNTGTWFVLSSKTPDSYTATQWGLASDEAISSLTGIIRSIP